MSDRSLVPKQVTAFRGGKPYMTTVYVRDADLDAETFRARNATLTSLVSAAAYRPPAHRFVADIDPHAPREVTDGDIYQDGDHAAQGEPGDTCPLCGQTVAGAGLHGYPAERADLPGGDYPEVSGYLALPATDQFDEGDEAVWASAEHGFPGADDPETLPYGELTWAVWDRFAGAGERVCYARGEGRAWELARQRYAAHARAEDPGRYADLVTASNPEDLQESWRAALV